MKSPNNRMTTPTIRTPVPVERVLVTPPPESIIKCPHCGAARTGQWQANGTWGPNQLPRKICRACGVQVRLSLDYKTIVIVG
jgi:hypothetical protein